MIRKLDPVISENHGDYKNLTDIADVELRLLLEPACGPASDTSGCTGRLFQGKFTFTHS
jgi:hypothetical protein